MKVADWIIINISTGKAIYGGNDKTMRFTTKEVADEVARQLFKPSTEFLIVNIETDLGL